MMNMAGTEIPASTCVSNTMSTPRSMTVGAHHGGLEVIDRFADAWRELCEVSTDHQIFYRPEWIAAHIRAFSPEAEVVLLTVSSDEKLLFVLPMLLDRKVFSGVPVRRLRAPVGDHTGRFDAVRHSGPKGEAAVLAAWNHLQGLRNWDLLEFQDVPEGSTIAVLASAAGQSGFQVTQVPNRRNPYVPIPADPGELKKLPVNSRLRTKLRQIKRELESTGGLKLTRMDEADRAFLDRFYELESAGWKGEEGSAIACHSARKQFFDEVTVAGARFGYLSMYSLELNGELLAAHLGFSHRGRYFSPKLAYNEKFPQYAPGHLIVGEILHDCASREISEYDITGVNDDWKMKWTSQARAKFVYFIFRPSIAGRLAHSVRFRLRPAVKKLVKPLLRSDKLESSPKKNS